MSHKVTLLPGNHQLEAEAGVPLLQAALAAELLVPYGCRNGTCGACKARLHEGMVDHGNAPLTTLPQAEREEGRILMCCATALAPLVIECKDVRSAHDIPVRKMPCRVQSMEKMAPDVMILRLRLPANETLHFLPGQYVNFQLPDGQRRSFSIANAPAADGTLELHVRLIPGGQFTGHVFTAMRERDILRIEGPLGSFSLRNETDSDRNKPVVFLAGGTGFAPIKAIIEHMIEQEIERPAIHLYWGVRNPDSLYLDDLARRWQAVLPNFRYIPVVSGESPESWHGRTGLVHHAAMQDLQDMSGYQVYACGSQAMIEAARRDFGTCCGLQPGAFFADAFTFAANNPATQETRP